MIRASQPDLFEAQAPRKRSVYPQYPGAKASGTSAAAADSIAPFAAPLRARALAEVRKPENAGGLTADEIAAALGSTEFAVRPRITELKRNGEIVDTGLRRPNRSGAFAAVWTVSERGRN